MPRAPKKTKGAPWFYAYAKQLYLTDEQKQHIADDIMCLDLNDKKERKKAECLIDSVERFLGTYPSMVESTDKEPTIAQYIVEIKELRKKAWELKEECCSYSYWMDNFLKTHNIDTDVLVRELSKFTGGITNAMQKFDNKESRGHPKIKALPMLINKLNRLFEQYYPKTNCEKTYWDSEEENNSDNRKKSGRETARHSFISECLNIGKIKHPKDFLSLIYTNKTPRAEKLYIAKTG